MPAEFYSMISVLFAVSVGLLMILSGLFVLRIEAVVNAKLPELQTASITKVVSGIIVILGLFVVIGSIMIPILS